MRHRAFVLLLTLVVAAGCSVGNGNEEELIEGEEVPTPDTTPYLESSPGDSALDVERPEGEGAFDDGVSDQDAGDGEQ